MNKLKISIPAIALAMSSLAVVSCKNKNPETTELQMQKTEAVIQQKSVDTFESTNKNKAPKTPWWGTALATVCGIGVLTAVYRAQQKTIEKIKNIKEG